MGFIPAVERGGPLDSLPDQVAGLVKRLAYNYKLPYFTISPTFSICPEHGYIPGEHHTCPHEVPEEAPKESEPLPA